MTKDIIITCSIGKKIHKEMRKLISGLVDQVSLKTEHISFQNKQLKKKH